MDVKRLVRNIYCFFRYADTPICPEELGRREYPKKIIRVNDGAEFLLNERSNLYYLWLPTEGCPDSGTHGYTYERLMKDPRSAGSFKVSDGTEDLHSMKMTWVRKIKTDASTNTGCGD